MTVRFGTKPRRLVAVTVLCGAAVACAIAGPAVSHARAPQAEAAGEDSPWPRTEALRPNVRAVQRQVADLAAQVEQMEHSAENAEDWMTCIRYVPVNEHGDRDRQSGYLYDDRDGTGVGYIDALAVDRGRRDGDEDYQFIDFRGGGCRSDNPQPGGTAEPASVRAHSARSGRPAGLKRKVALLERRARRLFERSQRLETISERFDEWESCVSWVPVTELGDPEQKFGYLFGPQGGPAGYRAGLHIDRSDWDDPDYMFLALVGGDRPGHTCQDEPGEAVD